MERNFNFPKNGVLESSYNQALTRNEIAERHCKNFKEEYESLSSRLLSLRDKLKHDIMVPIGKLALMKGKLAHTNEILVSLGDGWFTKQSSAEAVEICKRRIKRYDEMLEKLIKEKDLLTSHKTFQLEHDVFSGNEIIESYDEDKEVEWKEKHRENVKLHKQREAKIRQKSQIKDDKDIMEFLDALELQEEMEDELNKLDTEQYTGGADIKETEKFSDTEEDYDSDDTETESLTCDGIETEKMEKSSNTNNVSKDEAIFMLQKVNNNRNTNVDENNQNISKKVKTRRKVSFMLETEKNSENELENSDETIFIRFKHSDIKTEVPKYNETKFDTLQQINSPSDIYKSISHSLTEPRSILKKSNSAPIETVINETYSRDINEQELDVDLSDHKKGSESIQMVTIGDVVEHSQETDTSPQESSSRPVSKFKAARKAAKK